MAAPILHQALLADSLTGVPATLGSTSAAGSTTSIALTASANIQAGDTVYVVISHYANSTDTVSSVSDGTNTYTLCTRTGNGASNQEAEVWAAVNCSAVTSPTITANFTGAVTFRGIGAARVTGVSARDANPAAVASSSTASPSLASGTLAATREVIFGAFAANTTASITESTGFTVLWNETTAGVTTHLAYRLVQNVTSITYNPSWTGATAAIILVTSFR